jgi:hypothetical protein
LTYGGSGSPQTLSFVPGDIAWEFQTPGNPSLSDLQSLYPTGGYTFNLTGGADGPSSATIDYAGDAYSNTPHLTAASFSALQGLNAADSITLDFNMMEVSGNATPGANAIFFSIFNSSGGEVFSDTLSTDATTVTIGGGILSAGQSYIFDLLFDDRITGTSGEVSTTQFYDTHTDGSFSTAAGAVPEPSTWAMMLIGFAGVGFAGYRSARKRSVAATAV